MTLLGVLFAIISIIGTAQYSMPLVLEFDPAEANVLQITEPPRLGSEVRTSQLVGGVELTLTFDSRRLLSESGVVATVRVDDVRIAGTGIDLLGLIPTGTLCIAPNPDLASGGVAFLRPVRSEAQMQLTLETLSHATNPALEGVVPPIPFGAMIDEEFELGLVELLGLLTGQEGTISVQQMLSDTLPDDIPVLGGSQVDIDATFTNVNELAPDPLLAECEAYLAGL